MTARNCSSSEESHELEHGNSEASELVVVRSELVVHIRGSERRNSVLNSPAEGTHEPRPHGRSRELRPTDCSMRSSHAPH